MPSDLIASSSKVGNHIAVLLLPTGADAVSVARALLAVDRLNAYFFVLWAVGETPEWPLLQTDQRRLYNLIADAPTDVPGTTIREAHISSPGFISIEGGEALAKLVDILHKGSLEKDQVSAVTRRIEADTQLIQAQVVERRLANLTATIDIMRNVGYPDSQIRSWLLAESRLPDLIGGPLTELRELRDAGRILDIVTEPPQHF